jgi:hypothetical protein
MATGGSSNERYVRHVVEKALNDKWFDQKQVMTELTKPEHTTRNRMRKTLPTRGELYSMLRRADWLDKEITRRGESVEIRFRVKNDESEMEMVHVN